jgi:hypothetical protein
MLSIWQSFSLDCKKLKVARAYRPIFRRQALKPEVKALSPMIPLSAWQWDCCGRSRPSIHCPCGASRFGSTTLRRRPGLWRRRPSARRLHRLIQTVRRLATTGAGMPERTQSSTSLISIQTRPQASSDINDRITLRCRSVIQSLIANQNARLKEKLI